MEVPYIYNWNFDLHTVLENSTQISSICMQQQLIPNYDGKNILRLGIKHSTRRSIDQSSGYSATGRPKPFLGIMTWVDSIRWFLTKCAFTPAWKSKSVSLDTPQKWKSIRQRLLITHISIGKIYSGMSTLSNLVQHLTDRLR